MGGTDDDRGFADAISILKSRGLVEKTLRSLTREQLRALAGLRPAAVAPEPANGNLRGLRSRWTMVSVDCAGCMTSDAKATFDEVDSHARLLMASNWFGVVAQAQVSDNGVMWAASGHPHVLERATDTWKDRPILSADFMPSSDREDAERSFRREVDGMVTEARNARRREGRAASRMAEGMRETLKACVREAEGSFAKAAADMLDDDAANGNQPRRVGAFVDLAEKCGIPWMQSFTVPLTNGHDVVLGRASLEDLRAGRPVYTGYGLATALCGRAAEAAAVRMGDNGIRGCERLLGLLLAAQAANGNPAEPTESEAAREAAVGLANAKADNERTLAAAKADGNGNRDIVSVGTPVALGLAADVVCAPPNPSRRSAGDAVWTVSILHVKPVGPDGRERIRSRWSEHDTLEEAAHAAAMTGGEFLRKIVRWVYDGSVWHMDFHKTDRRTCRLNGLLVTDVELDDPPPGGGRLMAKVRSVTTNGAEPAPQPTRTPVPKAAEAAPKCRHAEPVEAGRVMAEGHWEACLRELHGALVVLPEWGAYVVIRDAACADARAALEARVRRTLRAWPLCAHGGTVRLGWRREGSEWVGGVWIASLLCDRCSKPPGNGNPPDVSIHGRGIVASGSTNLTVSGDARSACHGHAHGGRPAQNGGDAK